MLNPVFRPYVNGVSSHPGFSEAEKCRVFFEKILHQHRVVKNALVIGYPEKAKDGVRSEYFDWTQGRWTRSPLDTYAATYLAKQSFGSVQIPHGLGNHAGAGRF